MDYTVLMPSYMLDNYINHLLANEKIDCKVVSDKRSGDYSMITAVTSDNGITELFVEGIIRDGEYLNHETDVLIIDKRVPIEVLFKFAKHVEYEDLRVV